jgi:acetolactate decarboxylase
VAWAGAQRDVLAGDLRVAITLGELRALEHLYALGPLEGLRGEISVFDGVPVVARVREGTVVTDADRDAGACFLVYAAVARWRFAPMPGPLASADVAAEVGRRAAALGAGGAPCAFLLRGIATELVYHVLDKRDGDGHSPERHARAKVHFALREREVEVLGFHSAAHRGIFTPGDSDLHMHFRTRDGGASGHVERLTLAPGSALGLPAADRP